MEGSIVVGPTLVRLAAVARGVIGHDSAHWCHIVNQIAPVSRTQTGWDVIRQSQREQT